ncbi:MAG TPA: carbohydrate kinase family protein [Tepidisphaeraceae bacterium]|nr:carbohydrate kinase family protein [Tepidisphaeraceae bacterium]
MDAALFGLIVADLIASPMDLRHPPAPGGMAVLDTLELTTGGNVCNTGIAMAKLGMRVAAAGLVGSDVLGVAITDRLRQAGLDVACVFADARAQTSATVVAVEPGGERAFLHTPGVTTLLDAAVFRRCIPLFAKCDLVQIGYFGLLPALTPELPNLLAELKATSPRTRIALDTVNPPADASLLDPILPHLDVFAPSRTEGQALTGETSPHKMVAAFRERMGEGLIGIKLDAEGCYLDDGRVSVIVPAYKIECIDTTGAGDTWFGGLLTALAKEMPLEQAGKFANRAAADCCTGFGASAGVRSFDETLKRL